MTVMVCEACTEAPRPSLCLCRVPEGEVCDVCPYDVRIPLWTEDAEHREPAG